MAISIVMPALELAQETGTLIAWRKKEGEHVAKGEPLMEVETDKTIVEIESPADGVLTGLKAREGDVVPVGQVIAWIISPGEKAPS
jgi:pyruvate dehydrogenase E2 component (dihydrolipoamide acetyltransferase)